jgi:hypothetical protein
VVLETLKKVEGINEDIYPNKKVYLGKGKKGVKKFYNLRYINSIGSDKRIYSAYLSMSRINSCVYFEAMN